MCFSRRLHLRSFCHLSLIAVHQVIALPPAIVGAFNVVSIYPNFTGTSQWASEGVFDSNVTEPILFPWQLIFVPNSRVQQMLPEQYSYTSSAGYSEQLLHPSLAGVGELLYHVFALDRPGEQAFLIGELTATSNFHRSNFGDRKLFFKHTATSDTH